MINKLTTSKLHNSRDRIVQKLNTACHRVLMLKPELTRVDSDFNYFLLPFICKQNAIRNLTS